MERTAVCRIYGNSELGNMLANTLAQPELERLRAEVGVAKSIRTEQYRKMIEEANRKYAVKKMSKFKQKVWGLIGLVLVVMKEGFVVYDPD